MEDVVYYLGQGQSRGPQADGDYGQCHEQHRACDDEPLLPSGVPEIALLGRRGIVVRASVNEHKITVLDSDAKVARDARARADSDRPEFEPPSVIDDLNDRFGKLPEAARALVSAHRLRLLCRELGIRKIDAAESAVVFTFAPRPNFDPMALIKLLQSRTDLRMMPGEKLRLTISSQGLDARMRAIYTVINALRPAPQN